MPCATTLPTTASHGSREARRKMLSNRAMEILGENYTVLGALTLLGWVSAAILVAKKRPGDAIAAFILSFVPIFGLVCFVYAMTKANPLPKGSALPDNGASERTQLDRRMRFTPCAECHQKNYDAGRFCTHCGADMFANSDSPYLKNAVSQHSNNSTETRDGPVESIKVRCTNCKKKFRGDLFKIYALETCPRCKTTPFEFDAIHE